MPDCCSWLSRSGCCRRHSQQAYIYLYSPTMAGSSSLHWCLVCILFGLCLAFVVILAAVVIYHLNSSILISTTTTATIATDIDSRTTAIAKKRQLPHFVNTNIDPCVYFYNFVCDKLTRKKSIEKFSYDEDKLEQTTWTRIRHEFHDRIMSNTSNQSINQSLTKVRIKFFFFSI